MPEKFTLAGVQMDPTLMDKEANLAGMIDSVEQAAAEQARLVVFPECALTGYCFDSLEEALPYAESIPGPSTRLLAGLCRRTQTYLVLGMLEKEGDRCFNAAALIGPEGMVGKYRKVHLPYLGVGPLRGPRRSRFRGSPDSTGAHRAQYLLRRILSGERANHGPPGSRHDSAANQLAHGSGGVRRVPGQRQGAGKQGVFGCGQPGRPGEGLPLHRQKPYRRPLGPDVGRGRSR